MKYLFREQVQWYQQGRFTLDAKDMLKLKMNCDRMFANVRDHLSQVAKANQSPQFKGLKPEDLKLPAKKKKDAAKAAEEAIRKEAEADPLAWAIKQVDAFYAGGETAGLTIDEDFAVFDMFMNITDVENVQLGDEEAAWVV